MANKHVNIPKRPLTKEDILSSSPTTEVNKNYSPEPQMNPDKLISVILPLSKLYLPEQAQLTLNTYFSGYRNIGSINNSFGLSFIFSLIDYSIHFNQTEKLSLIQSLYSKYSHEMQFGEIKNQEEIITSIIKIIKGNNSASEKLETLQQFIDYYDSEYIFLYRNCMNVIAKLCFYSKESEILRNIFELSDIHQIISSTYSPFPKELYMYFVEYFKIRICELNSTTFEIDQMGSQLFPPLYILNIKDNYYPLSTNFELALRTLKDPYSYQGMIDFIVESEKLKNSNSAMHDLEAKIKLEETKNDELIEVFLKLVTNEEQYVFKKNQCLDGELTHEQSNAIASIVCDLCESIARTYFFECKHHLCAGCYYTLNYKNPLKCPLCGVVCYRIDST